MATSQSMGKFYENIKFSGRFFDHKLKCCMESDGKSVGGNRLSFQFQMMPSKSRLSFSVIEIIAPKDKLLFDKNIKNGIPLALRNQKTTGLEELQFCWKLFGMCISNSEYA